MKNMNHRSGGALAASPKCALLFRSAWLPASLTVLAIALAAGPVVAAPWAEVSGLPTTTYCQAVAELNGALYSFGGK